MILRIRISTRSKKDGLVHPYFKTHLKVFLRESISLTTLNKYRQHKTPKNIYNNIHYNKLRW